MFSRKDIDHGFIEQPLWFGQFFTHTRKPITTLLETLKVASRTNGKRLRAEMPIQIRLLMYRNTRTTQSNFLSLLISLSLSDFFVWWTWNLSCVKRPRTKERRDKQREKAVTWSPLALVDCRKRHPKGGFSLLRKNYAWKMKGRV